VRQSNVERCPSNVGDVGSWTHSSIPSTVDQLRQRSPGGMRRRGGVSWLNSPEVGYFFEHSEFWRIRLPSSCTFRCLRRAGVLRFRFRVGHRRCRRGQRPAPNRFVTASNLPASLQRSIVWVNNGEVTGFGPKLADDRSYQRLRRQVVASRKLAVCRGSQGRLALLSFGIVV